MYYSENVRKKKVSELENNAKFMEYAQQVYEEHKSIGLIDERTTLEEHLLREVFVIYDNFTMMQFLENSDQKTIDKVLTKALKGLDF